MSVATAMEIITKIDMLTRSSVKVKPLLKKRIRKELYQRRTMEGCHNCACREKRHKRNRCFALHHTRRQQHKGNTSANEKRKCNRHQAKRPPQRGTDQQPHCRIPLTHQTTSRNP